MAVTPPQSALSRTVLDKFRDQCNWAHEVWTLRRALIDHNRRKKTLQRGPYFYFVVAIGNALHDYSLQQIAKLHDPAASGRRVSLTFEYVVEYGGWDTKTLRRLKQIKGRLDSLYKQIRPARNQLLAHNDLGALLIGAPLGDFKEGADKRYFKSLFTFLVTAYRCVTGGPCAEFSSLKQETSMAVAALADATMAAKRRRRS
jgi:AbiU2